MRQIVARQMAVPCPVRGKSSELSIIIESVRCSLKLSMADSISAGLREHLTFLQPIKGLVKISFRGIDKDLLLCYSFCHHIEIFGLDFTHGIDKLVCYKIDVGGGGTM